MDTKDTSKRRKFARLFTLPELLGVLTILAFLSAIFFPLFQQTRSLPNGEVQDGFGRPLSGAVLRFHDQTGRVITTVTSDNYGSFSLPHLDSLSHDAVYGFGLTRMGRRTGAGTLYTFTPLGTHIATFRLASGKPISGFRVALMPNYYAWHQGFDEPFKAISDKNGSVQVPNMPLGGRFGFLSQDRNYIVERTQATVNGNTIRYAVTVTTPGTITGSLQDENGQSLRGYKAFATVSPDLNHFDRWYGHGLVTGTNGRFRITNLKPRTYYVSVALARGYHALLPAKRITLGPGQTAEVGLQADPMDLTPDAN